MALKAVEVGDVYNSNERPSSRRKSINPHSIVKRTDSWGIEENISLLNGVKKIQGVMLRSTRGSGPFLKKDQVSAADLLERNNQLAKEVGSLKEQVRFKDKEIKLLRLRTLHIPIIPTRHSSTQTDAITIRSVAKHSGENPSDVTLGSSRKEPAFSVGRVATKLFPSSPGHNDSSSSDKTEVRPLDKPHSTNRKSRNLSASQSSLFSLDSPIYHSRSSGHSSGRSSSGGSTAIKTIKRVPMVSISVQYSPTEQSPLGAIDNTTSYLSEGPTLNESFENSSILADMSKTSVEVPTPDTSDMDITKHSPIFSADEEYGDSDISQASSLTNAMHISELQQAPPSQDPPLPPADWYVRAMSPIRSPLKPVFDYLSTTTSSHNMDVSRGMMHQNITMLSMSRGHSHARAMERVNRSSDGTNTSKRSAQSFHRSAGHVDSLQGLR